jgi:hypothetical protein
LARQVGADSKSSADLQKKSEMPTNYDA